MAKSIIVPIVVDSGKINFGKCQGKVKMSYSLAKLKCPTRVCEQVFH